MIPLCSCIANIATMTKKPSFITMTTEGRPSFEAPRFSTKTIYRISKKFESSKPRKVLQPVTPAPTRTQCYKTFSVSNLQIFVIS
jgi:hypothetical protein